MSRISSEEDFNIIYYIGGHMRPKDKEALIENAENRTVLKAPEEFRDDVNSEFCKTYSVYRVSTQDPHPSPRGHKLLARPLEKHILNTRQGGLLPNQGLIQYLDPC